MKTTSRTTGASAACLHDEIQRDLRDVSYRDESGPLRDKSVGHLTQGAGELVMRVDRLRDRLHGLLLRVTDAKSEPKTNTGERVMPTSHLPRDIASAHELMGFAENVVEQLEDAL